MAEAETYLVHAKTNGSAVSIATDDPADALRRAREMHSAKCVVTITDPRGNVHTTEDLEAAVLSGAYAKPEGSDS